MAIQLEKENSKFNIYEQHFLIDSAADLQSIESEYDCHQGDKAELPDGSYYLRHSDDYQGEKWELAKSSGGGSGLPDYSEASEGDVLSIENGAPAWKEPSGGGGAFVVELSGYRPNIITETTYAEVVAAISAGKTVYIHHIDYLGGYYIPASYYLSHDGDDDYVDIQGEWSELSPEDDGSGGEIYYRIVYRVTVTLYPNAENNGIELLGMKFEIVEV